MLWNSWHFWQIKSEIENISNAWMNQNDSEWSSRNRTSSECSDQLFNPSSVDSLFSYSKSLEITKTGSIRVVKQTFVGPLRPSTADFNMQTRRTLIFIYSSIPIPLVIEHWCHILTSGSCLRSIPISDSLKKGINYRFNPLWVPKISESVPKRDSIIENMAAWISALYLAYVFLRKFYYMAHITKVYGPYINYVGDEKLKLCEEKHFW